MADTMTRTFSDSLSKFSITIPDHLIADAEVPVLTGAQAQGDVGIFPTANPMWEKQYKKVSKEGVQVVKGEATGNTHWLDGDGPIFWAFATGNSDPAVTTVIGELHVPEGSTAYLTHTDEHGSNGIGAGTYTLKGKRVQSEIIERVYD